jgi:hypothetical protein
MRNGEVLHRVKGERNILHTVKRKQDRNCLLKHIIHEWSRYISNGNTMKKT